MILEYILRICFAALLGGIIGLDREYRAKDAGFRTHFLVALGSALFMILSLYGFESVRDLGHMSVDPSRIASQVVTGIGFLGAGTIIFQKHILKGLTTAAGIWVTAAIGLACGAGMYIISIVCTLLVLICLEAFNYFLRHFGGRNISIQFSATSKEKVRSVIDTLSHEHVDINTYNMEKKCNNNNEYYYIVNMEIYMKREGYITHLMDLMQDFDGVSIDNIE